MDAKEVDTFRRFQAFVEKVKVALPSGDVSVEVQDQADSTEETSETREVNEHDELKYESNLPEEEPSDKFGDDTTGSSQTDDQVEVSRDGLKANEVNERKVDYPNVSTSVKAMLRFHKR